MRNYYHGFISVMKAIVLFSFLWGGCMMAQVTSGGIFVEAESMDFNGGVGTQASSEGTDNVGWIEAGDYSGYSNIGLNNYAKFEARVASPDGGARIEVRLGSPDGMIIGECLVPQTGGFQTWATVSCDLIEVTGVHTIYLVYQGGAGFLFNINWFRFTDSHSFVNAVVREAEARDSQLGTNTQGNAEGSDKISSIHDGDWALYEDVDFGSGMVRFEARVTSGWSGGWIEVRLDGPTGALLGRALVVTTDGWNNWRTRFCEITKTAGVQDVCLVFRKDVVDANALFDINWIRFTDEPITTTGNPIIEHIRTADPSVHVWEHLDDGKFWMYASHDMNDATGYESMDGYHVFSSSDLENWTDHGEVLHSRDVSWGRADGGFMWAPDCAYKDGTYYFYYPHKDASETWRIGVATSDKPEGPFVDIGNYIAGTDGIDPSCFIDDDGQAYLYFGHRRVAKLKENMIELAETKRAIEIGSDFSEGAWMHKRDGIYYYSYTWLSGPGFQGYYGMSDSPYGPFEFQGPVNRNPLGAQDHHSIVEHDGQWYYFYHVGGAGPNPWQRRMVCVDYLYYNSDGTMQLVEMTDEGVDILDDPSLFSVKPEEYLGGLLNPLKGFRPDTQVWNYDDEYAAITRCYIRWNDIENDESDTTQKIKDYCDVKWAGVEELGIKVIPRVFLDWDGTPGKQYWPADMTSFDYSSPVFKQRLTRLIERLGECWDNDPRVAWVQLGIIGKWGEHHSPEPTPEMQTLMGDAISEAFVNKKVLVRHADEFTDYEVGVYWDSWAHNGQMDRPSHGLGIELLNDSTERWKTHPIEGEAAYNWGSHEIQPGDDPDDTLTDPVHLDFFLDSIRKLHCTGLGWVASYDQTNEVIRANASEVQKAFGYRFVVTHLSYSRRTESGGVLDLSFSVRNTGSAPFYEDWPVELSLLDPQSHAPVWKTTLDGVDVSEWLPGDDWDDVGNFYASIPQLYTVEGGIQLPGAARLPDGEYIVALSILDPVGLKPSIRFAIRNYLDDGRHPFGRIGIGVDVEGEHAMNPADFDELQGVRLPYAMQVSPPPVPAEVTDMSLTGGQFRLEAAGSGLNEFRIIQRSFNLIDWEAVDVQPGAGEFFEWVEPIDERAFFRVVTE